jgi:hypothetical protein
MVRKTFLLSVITKLLLSYRGLNKRGLRLARFSRANVMELGRDIVHENAVGLYGRESQ